MEVVPAIPDPEFRDSSVGKFKPLLVKDLGKIVGHIHASFVYVLFL
jgi:hypothetical protein